MFSAADAARLADQASGKYEKICERIGEKVKELSEVGKREYAIYETGYWSAEPTLRIPGPTEAQRLLMTCLRKYGYFAELLRDGETYVPRGLADDYDNSGPEHQNWCIVIRW